MDRNNVDFLNSMINRIQELRNDVTLAEFERLTKMAAESLANQATLLEIEAPIYVCGDLHGDIDRLFSIPKVGGKPPQSRYLFLGNYVDYGDRSVETFCLLLALKIRFPDNVYLLRGNHEDGYINVSSGFKNECNRYHARLWNLFMSVYPFLPISAMIGGRIFCTHGNIPRILKGVDVIKQFHRPIMTIPSNGILCCLLWPNPIMKQLHEYELDDYREIGCITDEKELVEICQKFDIDFIITAKERTLTEVGTLKVFRSERAENETTDIVFVDERLGIQFKELNVVPREDVTRNWDIQIVTVSDDKSAYQGPREGGSR